MRKKVLNAATAAALALSGSAALTLSGLAAAQTPDVRQEDRQADRQQDRQADRRVDANEVEVKLALPRNADGTVNQTALLNDVRTQFAAGTTEIQFRGATAQDAKQLLDQKLFATLAPLLPNDGIERSVRLRGAFDARLQRNDEGELRARIEDINLGTLSPAQRAELARQLASQAGLDRIRIRGTDANGARVRIEIRDGVVKKNEGGGAARADNRGNARNDNARNNNARDDKRVERTARIDNDDRRGRRGGADRAERVERPERAARVERPERVERVERPERVERVERPERVERVERPERPERSGGNSGRG
jgi:hypothetical protein